MKNGVVMARDTMTPLINHLRQKANASDSGETFNGVTYWTDDQLEAVLDEHAEIVQTPIIKVDYLNSQLYTVQAPKTYWFESGFTIYKDGTKSILTDTYTFDPLSNILTFDTDVANYDYNIQGRAYRMTDAIANVWLQKAQQRENYITFKASSHRMEANQTRDFCMSMYEHWRGKAIRRFKRRRGGFVRQW